MKVTLTEWAKNYVMQERAGRDVAIFIFQSECFCTGIHPEVIHRPKADVNPAFLKAYFEEVGKFEGISIYLDKRLKDYFGSSDLIIDVDGGLKLKSGMEK
ncbi:MAG: hypothetical protein QXI39_03960 [Candidatus Bathyarchaeia archaeon]